MSLKHLMYLTSALAAGTMLAGPAMAQTDGVRQTGDWGETFGKGMDLSNLACQGVPGVGTNMNIRQMNVPGVNANASALVVKRTLFKSNPQACSGASLRPGSL